MYYKGWIKYFVIVIVIISTNNIYYTLVSQNKQFDITAHTRFNFMEMTFSIHFEILMQI